jgi:hypothetical protein
VAGLGASNAAVEFEKPVAQLFETVVVLRHDISKRHVLLCSWLTTAEADSLVPSGFWSSMRLC